MLRVDCLTLKQVMIMLNNNQFALLELLKASLFEIELVTPTDVEWDAVLAEAKAQTVVALAAKAVPAEYVSQWQNYALQSQAHFVRVLHGQSQLVNLLKQAGIPLVILKGTAAAMYYPEPFRRAMGDVDFLVPQDKFEEAVQLLEANGYKPFRELQNQLDTSVRPRHIEFGKDGIEYELHHHFSANGIDIESTLINGLEHVETAEIGGLSFPVLPAMENGLLLLAHAAFHLSSSELGLRQVIDWMMFVHQELDDEKWKDCFCEMVEQAGLRKLAVALTRLCRDHLGLPGEYRWCEEADEQVVSHLLNLIYERGNFGKKVPNHYNIENITSKVKSKGFFAYLRQISDEVWKRESIQSSIAVIRPFLFIKKFCVLLRSRFRASKGHLIKDLKSGNDLSKLYKELGLNKRI